MRMNQKLLRPLGIEPFLQIGNSDFALSRQKFDLSSRIPTRADRIENVEP